MACRLVEHLQSWLGDKDKDKEPRANDVQRASGRAQLGGMASALEEDRATTIVAKSTQTRTISGVEVCATKRCSLN